MRNVREILRLKHQVKLSSRQVAASLGLTHKTVRGYLARAEAAGLSWPLPEDLNDTTLEDRLFPRNEKRNGRPGPDFARVHRELSRHKHVTLELVWKEYKRENPDGFQYSHFCDLYRAWLKTVDVCMRHTHLPGDKLFIDFAGDTVPVVDPATSEILDAHVFAAVLGYSNYTFAAAFPDETVHSWVNGVCDSLEFFGGVPRILVPDNPKSVVNKACRYEPEVITAFKGLAAHYGLAVMPTRPYKPKDKAKVEAGVGLVERQVLAPLRHRSFFGLAELNQAIAELLLGLNQRPFQKLEGSRYIRFEEVERSVLRPLPEHRYELADWHKVKVHVDYHIQVDHNFYSVPYKLQGQTVDVRLTASTVEVLYKGERVASHPRFRGKGHYSTDYSHMPTKHQKYQEHSTVEWVVAQAAAIGPNTAQLVQAILDDRQVPEQGIKSCQGILHLSKKCDPVRMEAVAARALALGALSYKSMKSMLDKGLDRLPAEISSPMVTDHANLRGPAYYGGDH